MRGRLLSDLRFSFTARSRSRGKSSAERSLDVGRDLLGILHAGGDLEGAGRVDPERVKGTDGVSHVVRAEASREEHRDVVRDGFCLEILSSVNLEDRFRLNFRSTGL